MRAGVTGLAEQLEVGERVVAALIEWDAVVDLQLVATAASHADAVALSDVIADLAPGRCRYTRRPAERASSYRHAFWRVT